MPITATRSDNLPLAVGTIILTVFALSLGDALIKLTSENFVIWQIFVTRSAIAIPCLVIYMAICARSSLRMPTSPIWTIVRSLLLVFMWVSYYISLPHMALSAAAAAYYTLPIFIALFSAVIVGDTVSRTGWIAVISGFLGVVLILKPNVEDFNWYALLPLLAAILYALAMILTRTKCRSEHPLLLSLTLNISFVIVGSVTAAFIATLPNEIREGFLLAPWAAMGSSQWLSMSLLAVAILIGSIGAAIAYQNGPSSVIGIFDFAYVGFAALWGILLFTEIPDVISVTGTVLIVTAGVMSLRQ